MTTHDAREQARQTAETRRTGGDARGLDRKVLADLVLEAVRRIGAEELNPPITTETSPAFQPRAMLAMLTYCYANGVYGSEDVEQMMYEDTAFRALCGMDYPDHRRLRRFRRNNHGPIQKTLEETLRGAWSSSHEAGLGDGIAKPESSNGLLDAAGQDWIAREARNRIEKAMFIDHMATE